MKHTWFLLTLALLLLLSACGVNDTASQQSAAGQGANKSVAATASEAEQGAQSTPEANFGTTLIAYFSLGEHFETPEDLDAVTSASLLLWDGELTGNAGVIARMIQSQIGGDLFSIRVEKQYPGDTNEVLDLGLREQRKDERPALTSQVTDFEQYDTVFLVYPTWWYKMPMAVYSFFDAYDFSGKTIYVVNTSSGSGFGSEIRAIETLEPEAVVIQGIALLQDRTLESENELTAWLDTLGTQNNE